MYAREATSPRKNGPNVTYVQLVEGHRNPTTGKVETRIVYSFGRKDQLKLDQIRRLVVRLNQ